MTGCALPNGVVYRALVSGIPVRVTLDAEGGA